MGKILNDLFAFVKEEVLIQHVLLLSIISAILLGVLGIVNTAKYLPHGTVVTASTNAPNIPIENFQGTEQKYPTVGHPVINLDFRETKNTDDLRTMDPEILASIDKIMAEIKASDYIEHIDLDEEIKEDSIALLLFEERTIENAYFTDKILENYGEYPRRILNILGSNFEMLPYVADYLEEVDTETDIVITESELSAKIPHFIQWDHRWGYTTYGRSPMGIAGCGPTSLSMVLIGILGDSTLHPQAIATYAVKNEHLNEKNDTEWSLFTVGAKAHGVYAREISLDYDSMVYHLKKGRPIIASMGPGNFTNFGHILVITEVTELGDFKVLDPNSYDKTNQEWSYDLLKKEIRNLWAYDLESF